MFMCSDTLANVGILSGSACVIYTLQSTPALALSTHTLRSACCTSNFNFGWPRFIQKMIHLTPDNGVAISMIGPATATLPNGAVVAVTGDYPFEDSVTITISNRPANMPLYVRIPKWATASTLAVNGGAPVPVGAAAANTMFAVPLSGVTGPTLTVIFNTNPSIRVDRWYNGECGADLGCSSARSAATHTIAQHPLLRPRCFRGRGRAPRGARLRPAARGGVERDP